MVHARHQPWMHLRSRDGPETTHRAAHVTMTHNQVAWRKLLPPCWVCVHTALNIDGNRESQVRLSRQATAPTLERSQAALSMVRQCGSSSTARCEHVEAMFPV